MRPIPFPADWTAFTSAAALMRLSGVLTNHWTALQQRHAQWELEKYGPCYCELPAPALIERARAYLSAQLERVEPEELHRVALVHGSRLLKGRGREALNHAVSSMARVARLGGVRELSGVAALAHTVLRHSEGQMSVDGPHGRVHFGHDEVQLYGADALIQRRPPSVADTARRVRRTVELLELVDGWTHGHSCAFLLKSCASVDLPRPQPLPDGLWPAVRAYAPRDVTRETIERDATRFLDTLRAEDDRWLFIRAFEDELAALMADDIDNLRTLLHVMNKLVKDGGVTPYRRDLLTRAMAIFALGEAADRRPRALD